MGMMGNFPTSLLALAAISLLLSAQTPSTSPLRLGVVGLVHGHVAGFFSSALGRSDVQIVGIAESDRGLFNRYAQQYRLDPRLFFATVGEMVDRVHPQAVVVYTSTFDHRRVVEECARRGVHVMMEKPLAVSYEDARAIADAAGKAKIHVLVNYETTWYPSNEAVFEIAQQGGIGNIRKIVAHDGHPGPKEIHVQPEFFAWLTDPKLNGAGALFDFGCYGADLATWLMNGQPPLTVTAVTEQIKPNIYSNVDDEADVILTYPKAIAIIQGSWNWPFDRKDLEVYGDIAYVKTVVRDRIQIRLHGDQDAHMTSARPLKPPYDDPLHYLSAVVTGKISHEDNLSSLRTNVLVVEILDAARRSAGSGKTISLPLNQ